MADINIRGELWDNDSADILRWWGWRDLTAPGDIAAERERSAQEDKAARVRARLRTLAGY